MGAKSGEVLTRALTLISNHPLVSDVGAPVLCHANGTTIVDVSFDINLPNEWRRRGESPHTGVRLQEVARIFFPAEFPFYPPTLSLRADFNRNLPHMQPWLIDGCPVPCIYDGDPAELFLKEGMAGFLNRFATWLDRAAMGKLIDPEQGWEPVRRDSLNDSIVADAQFLDGLVKRNGGYRFLIFNYVRIRNSDGTEQIHGHVLEEVIKLNPKVAASFFVEKATNGNDQLSWGKALAMIVWPGKHPSGQPIICDTYLPETVYNVNCLMKRSKIYGCANELKTGINRLNTCLSGYNNAGPFAMAVILVARRPYHLIGNNSTVELCPYVMNVIVPQLLPDGGTTVVRPAAHHHTMSRTHFAQISGRTATTSPLQWTLIGAGSLGSKIALHLARTGSGPTVVVDKSVMSPHNAARHALVPTPDHLQISWTRPKAQLLSEALRGLNQDSTSITYDMIDMLASQDTAQGAFPKQSWAIVNTTASLVVREALTGCERMRSRVVEASLFSGGRVGVLTVEGPVRNPNSADLAAEFYALAGEDPELTAMVFANDDSLERRTIGQGCGSMTMPMSDGRLSLFAAGMSEYLYAKQRDGLPNDTGEILIGRLSEDGLGMKWRHCRIGPTTVVNTINGEPWSIRIHKRAADKMNQDAARWTDVETGGVLIGRLSQTARVAHVVDVLESPEDSFRSSEEFILGTKGLKPQLERFTEHQDCSLYCLGTWHTHLYQSGPSAVDQAMACAVSVARMIPSIFLILDPSGFHGFVASMDGGVEEQN